MTVTKGGRILMKNKGLLVAKRKILVAGMGTSPAVLTNAVWALAQGMWGFGIIPSGGKI